MDLPLMPRSLLCLCIAIAYQFILTSTLLGQHDEDLTVDSAYQLYLDQPSPETFLEYAYTMWFTDLDSAVILMHQAIHISESASDSVSTTAAYHDMARLQMDLNEMDSAEWYFQKAIDLANRLELYDKEAYAYNTRGYLRFNYLTNIKGAINDVNQAIRIFEKREDYLGLSFCYQNLGDFYYHFNQMDVAINMYSKIEEVRKKNHEPTPLYNKIEAIWNLSSAFNKAGRAEDALISLSKAIELLDGPKEEYKGFLWSRLHLIRAQSHTLLKDFQNAQKDIDEAETSFDKTSFLNIKELYNYSKGFLAFEMKEYELASKHLNELESIPYNEIADPLMKLEAYLMLEKIYTLKGQLDKAYSSHSQYSQLNDKLYNPQHLGYMMQEVRNFDDTLKLKDREIEESQTLASQLSTINIRNKIIIALLLIGLISSVYFFTNYRLKERLKREKLRTKISQDLHDEVGGILAGIALQSDILQLKEVKENEDIQAIAILSRQAMSKMGDVLWSIDARRDSEQNLIQRMREHGEELLTPLNILFTFQADGFGNNKMETETRQNIYLIYKEALSNVIKHANAKEVVVALENKDMFRMSIVNDGINEKSHPKKAGQGLENMRSRASILRGTIDIASLPTGHFQVLLLRPAL